MSELFEYKCPCCGGAIAFNSRVQKMKCPYCDTEFDLDTLKDFDEEHLETDSDPAWGESETHQAEQELDAEAEGLASYVCESCGGEIVTDAQTAAMSCPYCGNPVVMKKKIGGMLRPELVIPFKLDRKQAEEKLRGHLKGKPLLPSLFKSENRIKEVKGIYVPFWLYDCDAQAEIRCRATRTHTWEDHDYAYTETEHFLVCRDGGIGFDRVPADGSSKMPDDLMESIEPFHYEDAADFQTAYLAGYFADRYDVSSQECADRVNARIRQSTIDAFMGTISGYDTCVPEHTDISLQQGKITYALLPVWILNTVYKGKTYTFAMNGQTGKFVGDLPADRGMAMRIGSAVFAAAAIVSWLITALL